jgi:glycosyltransferase involved in cell wall biosynthesis
VPLVFGGGRFIVEWLEAKLRERGHLVETVLIPNSEEPATLLDQMLAFRLIELDEHFDRVITFRPPAHMVRHRRKVCWFIHHIRYLYDFWDVPAYNPVADTATGRALRDAVRRADTIALGEAHRLFTNSRVVGRRVKTFNGLDSAVLYPPIFRPEVFVSGALGDEVVCVCRMEEHKRQHLLVEAMAHVSTPVRLRLSGLGSGPAYGRKLRKIIADAAIEDRVTLEERWISEDEKAQRLAGSLAAAYVPLDEDSYGYPTLEAAHARRCTLVLSDGGGVHEFVEDGVNGLVAEPEPKAIAAALDRLYLDRRRTAEMGAAAYDRIGELGIDWDTVIEQLLA